LLENARYIPRGQDNENFIILNKKVIRNVSYHCSPTRLALRPDVCFDVLADERILRAALLRNPARGAKDRSRGD